MSAARVGDVLFKAAAGLEWDRDSARNNGNEVEAEAAERDRIALLEAREALQAMLREVDLIADALSQDGRTRDGMTKKSAAKRLRAAAASVGGAT